MKRKNDKDSNSSSSKKKNKTSKKNTSSLKNKESKNKGSKSEDIKKKSKSSNNSDNSNIINKEKNNNKKENRKSKKDIYKFLDALIQPLNGTQIYKQDPSDDQNNENAKVASSSKEDNSDLLFKVNEKTYKLTPKGILWAALDAYYKIGNDIDKFELFVKDILQSLSLLATGGTDIEVFGKDFNDFFELVVNMINTTGKMKEVLDQNGIEFDVKKYLAGEGDLGDEDDESNDEDSNRKPKKSR